MKKTFLAIFCAALAICACQKEEQSLVDVPTPYSGTVTAGVPASVKIQGSRFQETDSLYIAWGDASEALTHCVITETGVTFGIDAYSESKGQTVTAYLWRDGKSEAISGDIKVNAPTEADGFVIKDKELLASLKQHNGDVAAMIGECNLLDVAAAKALIQDTKCDNEWGVIAVDGNGATTFEGIEVFENLGKGLKQMTDEEYKNFICWGCGNIKEMDFSNWTAYVQVRAASCASLEKVVLGPNMKGGNFDGSPITYFDMHLASGADWVMSIGTNVKAEGYTGLKYANFARTYIAGGEYNKDFNHWRGSGNVKDIVIADDAEIHIDSEIYNHNWTGGGLRNTIKAAWEKGATVIVHDLNNYDQTFTVKSYKEDPNAMTAAED